MTLVFLQENSLIEKEGAGELMIMEILWSLSIKQKDIERIGKEI